MAAYLSLAALRVSTVSSSVETYWALKRNRAQVPRPQSARRVVELDAAAVLLQNAPDNGETKAGALLARREVRHEQPIAVLLGQAGADVDHRHNFSMAEKDVFY
jgi:hypothetical protein